MTKPNLTIKIETKNEIKKLRCSRCFGTGLIKREILFSCSNCENKYYNCFKCENSNKTLWIECIKCYGTGENKPNPKENKSKHKYINGYCRKSI
jgi:hypothetical protein